MKKKILVVEDDPHILRLLCHRMRKSYETLPASNGNQAVKIAASVIPDLIIMDIAMPELDGLKACRLIRDNPQTAEIPMLAATAKVSREDIQNIRNSGFDDVIQKPFSYKEMVPHIESLLKMKMRRPTSLEQIPASAS